MRQAVVIILLICFCAIESDALELRATVTPNQISSGDTAVFNLEMVAAAIPTVESVVFSTSSEFQLEESGRSQGISIVNGTPTASLMLQFLVQFKRDLQPGTYRLPDGVVTISGKPFNFKGPELKIVKSVAVDSPVDFLQIVNNLAPFEGEQVLYRCEILAKTEIANAVLENTSLEGFFREDFPTEKQSSRSIGGSRAKVFSFREAVYPNRSGELEIPPRGLVGKVKRQGKRRGWGSGTDMFDDLWSSFADEFSFESRRFVAPALKLNVRPLPPGPVGYAPVGTTSIEAILEKSQLRIGESVRLNVVISSRGNLRPFNFELTPPEELKAYPEKPVLETESEGDSVIQRKIFAYNLVPEYGGEFSLDMISVTFFDTEKEEYRAVNAQPLKILVAGAQKTEQSAEPTIQPEEAKPLPELFGKEALRAELSFSRGSMLFALTVILLLALLGVYQRQESSENTPREELARLAKREHFTDAELRRLRELTTELAPQMVGRIDRVLYGGEGDLSEIKSIVRELRDV